MTEISKLRVLSAHVLVISSCCLPSSWIGQNFCIF